MANAIYAGLVEGYAAEISARRNAMDNASKNAEEMIGYESCVTLFLLASRPRVDAVPRATQFPPNEVQPNASSRHHQRAYVEKSSLPSLDSGVLS